MKGIFVSYRREDAAGHAGRLFDRLAEHFGKESVFMDVEGIGPGVRFAEAIEKAVGGCDVFLAVIGRSWLDCGTATADAGSMTRTTLSDWRQARRFPEMCG